MNKYTSRERVLKAINHQEADRVPIYLGGSAGKFYISTAKKLMKIFSISENKLELKQTPIKYIPFCEELWQELGIDVRYIYPKLESDKLYEAQFKGKKYKNIWGSIFQFTDSGGEMTNLESEIPFKRGDLSELDNYDWPKADKAIFNGLGEQAKLLSNDREYAVAIFRPFMGGIFSVSRYCLRGSVNLFEDIILKRKFVEKLLDLVLEVQKEFYGILLDEVGNFADIIEIEDDLGMQTSMLISPESYRSIIKPKHKELVEFIKKKSPDIKVLLHCDGAIREVISDFIDIGIDILNPVQVSAKGMELKHLKNEFGKDIVFAGAVDVATMEGSLEDVKLCVKKTIDTMAPGGGYLLGPSHNFSTIVPPENIIAMSNFAREFGTYS